MIMDNFVYAERMKFYFQLIMRNKVEKKEKTEEEEERNNRKVVNGYELPTRLVGGAKRVGVDEEGDWYWA